MSKKFKLLPNFFLPKHQDMMLGLGMMFVDVSDRKEDFIDYKNATLSQSKNKHFS